MVRNANKVVDIAKPTKDSIITVALDESEGEDHQSRFEVEEEKKYATKTTDNMVTYYEYKRLRYPKQSEVNTTNVLERMDPSKENSPTAEHDQPRLAEMESGSPGHVTFFNVPPTNNAGDAAKAVSLSVMQSQQNSSVGIDGYPESFEGATVEMARESMQNSYRNLQKKSIFSITYDRINSRENISAGSENVS